MIVAALMALALLAVSPKGASAAGTEVQPREESVEVILDHRLPGTRPDLLEGTHVLTLRVYPLRGVAVATTASSNYEIENKLSATYAERIPKGPFDGHLDLHFKGLGTFVGDFVPGESFSGRKPNGCAGPASTTQIGNLDGDIEFHGGGFAKWSARRAFAALDRSPRLHCRSGAAEHEPEPKTLLDYVIPGFGSFNGWRYSLRSRLRRPHRFTEFFVYRYERMGVNFDATTYEYLPDGILASRSVYRSVPGAGHLEASHGGYHPEHATLHPPKPYSGVGIYSRATHRLTGSLAVQFPGLRLRLGSADTVANLVDEAGLSEKSPNEALSLDRRRPAPRLPDGDAREVTFFIRSHANRHKFLQLHLFPQKGVAVVDALQGMGLGVSGRSVAYAIAIPAAPFDGHLDLHLPGLGYFVGTVEPLEPLGRAAQAKLCETTIPKKARGSRGTSRSGATAATEPGGRAARGRRSRSSAGRNRGGKTGPPPCSRTSPKGHSS